MTRDALLTRLAALKHLTEHRITVVREIVRPADVPGDPPVVVGRYISGSFFTTERPTAQGEETEP